MDKTKITMTRLQHAKSIVRKAGYIEATTYIKEISQAYAHKWPLWCLLSVLNIIHVVQTSQYSSLNGIEQLIYDTTPVLLCNLEKLGLYWLVCHKRELKSLFLKSDHKQGRDFCKRIDIIPLIVLKCELICYNVQVPSDIKRAVCTESWVSFE